MRRMAGEDAGFLYMELPIQPMNTMVLAILAPAAGPDGRPDLMTLARMRGHMARRLDELPSFRWRVERVPLGLHHPVYIEDPDFDLDYHLRQVTVASPGGPEEVDRLFADLSEHPLDRRHPLWQMVLVDGVAGGRQAVICRMNHCLLDGVAVLTTLSRIFSGADHQVVRPSGSGPSGSGMVEPWTAEPVPSRRRLVIDAIRDRGRQAPGLPRLVTKTWRNYRAANAHLAQSEIAVPKPTKDTPPCGLNNAFTVGRAYTRAALPLADIKRVKDAAGVSLNDVALAIVAGALRQYLLDRHDLPERPLTVSVPVAFEPPDAPARQWGNRFSSLTSSLATDVEDPWERLQVISRVTAASRQAFELLGPELMPDWLEFVPPAVAERAMKAHHRSRRDDREKADVNVLVSNIRGPSAPWHFDTAIVDELYLSGPPSNGVGSNVMLWSYGDHLVFSILSFADAMESPREFGDALGDALTELMSLSQRPIPR